MRFVLMVLFVTLCAGWWMWIWRVSATGSTGGFALPLARKRGRGRGPQEDEGRAGVSVDGAHILGGVDANGNPCGMTAADWGSWWGAIGRCFHPSGGGTFGVTDSWGALDPVMSDSVGLTPFTGSDSFSCGSSFDSGFSHGGGCGFNSL
jgi:hypothetical protein